MLNVVQVCDHLGWPGSRMHGVKRLFAWMIPRFDPTRFHVSLVSLRRKDLSEDTLEQLGIDVTYLHKGKFDPSTWTALGKVFDAQRADIVHLHGYGATTFGRLAAATRGLPVLLHEHANHTDTPWFQKVADRILQPYTDLALAVSKSTAEFVVRARLVPSAKTKVVYLGVPLDEFARPRTHEEIRAARAALGIEPETFALGTITRLMPSKGNTYLIEAMKHVGQRLPDARCFIVGEGELQAELEAQARALGVSDRVRLTGFTRDVAAALSALDLVVFPSLWEGTPLTAFEALAMGKPIVATDADGLKDILTDGEDACVVPQRDARALGDAIVRLQGDRELRSRLGAHARTTGRRYDIQAFVHKMEHLYELMHRVSRATKREGLFREDLSFLGRLGVASAPHGAAKAAKAAPDHGQGAPW
ncbi:MAG: glycosyltransferase [Luteitalea sp.]|nr:glycosyltransferase [Luteitalea sp.]